MKAGKWANFVYIERKRKMDASNASWRKTSGEKTLAGINEGQVMIRYFILGKVRRERGRETPRVYSHHRTNYFDDLASISDVK